MDQPLVSIIVRTCQRPEVLREALDSIRRQTYSNIQVIVVEDGENAAEDMLEQDYSGMNYIYEATGRKQGRSRAGNRALQLATGAYINFLDDDDIFFEQHVQILVDALKTSEDLAAYSIAEERQIVKEKEGSGAHKIKRRTIRYNQPFNRLLLYTFNYIPIQSIMFHRSLFETLGGFDENLEALEDWDLWVRYSLKTDFLYVNKVTSGYHVPYKLESKSARAAGMREYVRPLHQKFNTYELRISVGEVNRDMTYVIREYKNKGLLRYLRMFFRVVFLGER
nr:glycosyltransferase [uncultured Acetatifactor sp.]